jgi:two-component system alkaline phosphatase synthesis response regulator PhoP
MSLPASSSGVKVLLVDDESDILEMLEYNLVKEGFKVFLAHNAAEALDQVRAQRPDLILLDIMLPEVDGVEICRRIRALPEGKDPYIIFLTARSEEYSEIAGLEAGGDDYISKPVKMRLLMTRITAGRRRSRAAAESPSNPLRIDLGELQINADEFLVHRKGKVLHLPKKEFELLFFLASHAGKVFTRDQLLENVWGEGANVVDRTVDVHIRKLREKIGRKFLTTIKGVGYKFVDKK